MAKEEKIGSESCPHLACTGLKACLFLKHSSNVQRSYSEVEEREKDPAAVSLGRRGGFKGGKKRMDGMTPEERAELGRKAAAARWKKDRRI